MFSSLSSFVLFVICIIDALNLKLKVLGIVSRGTRGHKNVESKIFYRLGTKFNPR